MADAGLPIGLPESTLGLIPGAGGTQRLARTLGPGRALELMLEGRPLLPDEALEVGIVHRVVEPGALMDEAMATAERLALRSPVVVKELKRAVYDGASRPLADGLHVERTGFVAAASSPEGQRAMKAYVEEVEDMGDVGPDEALAELERWRLGIAVDMTGEG
jgi:enoyl-CoA hydratase/carnithine racemase